MKTMKRAYLTILYALAMAASAFAQPIYVGVGCTTAYHIDKDCDGYGVGTIAGDPNPLLGPDADDNDATVHTAAQGITLYGSMSAFLDHLEGFTPYRHLVRFARRQRFDVRGEQSGPALQNVVSRRLQPLLRGAGRAVARWNLDVQQRARTLLRDWQRAEPVHGLPWRGGNSRLQRRQLGRLEHRRFAIPDHRRLASEGRQCGLWHQLHQLHRGAGACHPERGNQQTSTTRSCSGRRAAEPS